MLMSGNDYRESLRRYRPKVYLDGREVRSVADEPQIRFVNERGGLQRVAGPLGRHSLLSTRPELCVDEGEELIGPVARSDGRIGEKASHLIGGIVAHPDIVSRRVTALYQNVERRGRQRRRRSIGVGWPG